VRHGLERGHLHEFEIAGERYGIPDPEFDWGDPPRSSSASSSRRRWAA
jgi:hypothetical protein